MYRSILAAVVVAFSLVFIAALPVKAQTSDGMCIAKDQIIAMWAGGSPEINVQKVTGAKAEALQKLLASKGVEGGETFVMFWMDGADKPGMLIAAFDKANCFASRIKGPRDEILEVVNGVGA